MFPSIAIVLALPLGAAALPPGLTDLGFDEAVAANRAESDKILVVKFTASWCAPCKTMDRTTWSDDGVVSYLKEHGITAIPVDIDKHREIARANRVSSVPTMVIFQNGIEFDRSVGGMNATAMTDWLTGVRDGRRKADALRQRVEMAGGSDNMGMRDRFLHARGLARSGEWVAATDEFVWLWNNVLENEPAMHGVRVSFMASDMQELATQSEHARTAFTALRDGLTEKLENGETTRSNLTDWLVLSTKILGDDESVRAWVDRIWERPTGPQTLRAMGHIIDGWLIEQGEWTKAGVVQPPAAKFIAWQRGMLQSRFEGDHGPEVAAMLKESADRGHIGRFATYHAACLAAGRDEDAWKVAEALLTDFPRDDARAALCRDALQAGAVRARHAEIAGQITGTEGERLRDLIAQALSEKD